MKVGMKHKSNMCFVQCARIDVVMCENSADTRNVDWFGRGH